MKVSAVITYWRQLSQLYITWRGRRMNPLTFKAVSDVSLSGAAIEPTDRHYSIFTAT